MEEILGSLFSGPIASRLPGWAITIGFIMIILKYTGALEKWAKFVGDIFSFLRERDALEAEQELWEAKRESEIEELHANATVQAQASAQLADQRAQQQLYKMLEQNMAFLQTDFMSKMNELVDSHTHLSRNINDMKTIAAKARESLTIGHSRLDSVTSAIGQIAHNFEELKPYLTDLSSSSKGVKATVSELEGAIRLLVEVMKNE